MTKSKKTPDEKSPSGTEPASPEIKAGGNYIVLYDENGEIAHHEVPPEVAEGIQSLVEDYNKLEENVLILQEHAKQSILYMESLGGTSEGFTQFCEFDEGSGPLSGNA